MHTRSLHTVILILPLLTSTFPKFFAVWFQKETKPTHSWDQPDRWAALKSEEQWPVSMQSNASLLLLSDPTLPLITQARKQFQQPKPVVLPLLKSLHHHLTRRATKWQNGHNAGQTSMGVGSNEGREMQQAADQQLRVARNYSPRQSLQHWPYQTFLELSGLWEQAVTTKAAGKPVYM